MARKRGRSGRKKKEIDSDLIKLIPLVNRKNVRALAAGMSLSASTIHRVIKDGRIKRHSNAIKPFLTDENRKNVRALAAGMGLSASTIHRAIKDGRIKRHSNAIKPFLTDENQIERLRFLGTFAEFEVSDD